jgi:hypothetical protein
MRNSAILALALLAATASNAANKHPAKTHSAPAPATNPAAPSPASQLSLTIYNDNLVMVQDIRTLDLPAGRSRIALPGVSAMIRPETVSLTAKGLSVVEQNFDYDLLTPAKMMEKQVGHDIQIVRTNPATGVQTTETATVLSVNSGVVLRIGNRIEALRDDGLPTRVVFSSIPENLRASPTLSVTVDAAEAGPRAVDLSYLAGGISWSAAYVGMYDEKRGSLNLQGWVTIVNNSGTSFRDAETELIAGNINTTTGSSGRSGGGASTTPGTGAQQGANPLADFYAYRMPERVTVANQQTKQISFLDLGDARATKQYRYEAGDFFSARQAQPATVHVDFNNGNQAMPAGAMRIYMRDSKGEPKFIGEQGLSHTPAGSDIGIDIGDAFDVSVQPTIVSSETRTNGGRFEMKYAVRNARSEPVRVLVIQDGLNGGEVEKESQKSTRADANRLAWEVPVQAHGETTLTATIRTGS